jgi:hypothetical protein
MIIRPWYSFDDSGKQPSDSHKNHQSQVRRWCEAVYEEAKSELDRNEEIQNIDKYIRYLMGHQWPDKRLNYKSSPVDNRVWTNLIQLVSYLTDIRQSFEVHANNKVYNDTAEKINKIARSWFINQDVDITTAMVIIYSALSIGYARQVYNEDLNNGDGGIEITACGPLDVIPIKPTANLQGAYGLIYEKPMPLSWFCEKYPLLGELVAPDDNYSRYKGRENSNNSAWSFLGSAYRRLFGMNQTPNVESAIPMGRYREFWLKDASRNKSNVNVYVGDMARGVGYGVLPGGKLYPRGRLITMGGDVALYDGPNPFFHGRFPFAALRINQVPWMFTGVSEFRNQLPLQDTINSILAGILDMVKKAVNPPMHAPMNAFSDAVRKSIDPNMPGAKLYYNPGSGQPPQWQTPAVLPSYVFEALGYSREALTSQTGFLDPTAMAGKKIIPSDDTIESLSAGQQTVVRLKTRYIESFFREVGEQYIANVFQYERASRRMMVLGREGLFWTDYEYAGIKDLVPDGVKPQDHWKEFRWTIIPGSLLKSSGSQDQAKVFNLRRMGDIDRKTLYKAIDMDSISDTVEKNLRAEGADIILGMVRQKMSGVGGGGALSPDTLTQLNNATRERPEPIQ